MQYELVRSNRRTLAITIDGSGRCVVRAPMRMPMAEIKKFIEEKRSCRRRILRALCAKSAAGLKTSCAK